MGSEEPGGGEVLQKMWRDSGRCYFRLEKWWFFTMKN
jgi:hypothetical protein